MKSGDLLRNTQSRTGANHHASTTKLCHSAVFTSFVTKRKAHDKRKLGIGQKSVHKHRTRPLLPYARVAQVTVDAHIRRVATHPGCYFRLAIGEGRPRSFHPVFTGRGPFTALFCPQIELPRSFHPSVLATNREVTEGRDPFAPRFWLQIEK